MDIIVAIPDIHAPYHDKRATDLLQAVIEDLKPRYIRQVGDAFDFAQISKFKVNRKMHPFSTGEEVEVGFRLLDQLGDSCKDKVITLGNHENRWYNLLMEYPEMASAMEALGGVDFVKSFKKIGWKAVPYHDGTWIKDNYFTHDLGHYGKNAVRQTMAAAGATVLFGHSHRLSIIEESTALGAPLTGVNLGWLGDADKIDYTYKIKALRDWQLGFAVGLIDGRGQTHWQTVRIHRDYSCVVLGHHYKL